MAEKKRLFALDMLKLIAILLILNSHFDSLYPDQLKKLATGGTWGNTIFFAISGYLTNIDNGFFQYMRKRIVRLYPSVTIFTLISLVLHLRNISIENVMDIVAEFIWPTYYWFVGALVLFYILIFLLERIRIVSSKFAIFSFASGGILLLYYACFISNKNVWCIDKMGFDSFEGWIKILFFFYIFALGYYLKENNDICRKVNVQCSISFIVLGSLGYVGYKLLLVKAYIPMHFQIFAPVLACFLALGSLCLALKCEKNAEDSRNRESVAEKIVTCLSSLSLEIYLVQFTIIHFFESYIFPLNITMALLVIFIFAYLLKNLSSYITNKLTS